MRSIVIIFLLFFTELCAEEFPTLTVMDLACRSQFIVEAKPILLKDVFYSDKYSTFSKRVLLIEILSVFKSTGEKLPDTLQIQVSDIYFWGHSSEFLSAEKAIFFLKPELDQWYGTKGLLWYPAFSGILLSKNDSLYIPYQPSSPGPYYFEYWPYYKSWDALVSGLKRAMEATEMLSSIKKIQPVSVRNRTLLAWIEYYFPEVTKYPFGFDWDECSKDALQMILNSGLPEDMLEAVMWYRKAGRNPYWSSKNIVVPPFCSPEGRALLLRVASDTSRSQEERFAAMTYLEERDTYWPYWIGCPVSKEEQAFILSAMIKILEKESGDIEFYAFAVIQAVSSPPPLLADQRNGLAVPAVVRYYQRYPPTYVRDRIGYYLSTYLSKQAFLDMNNCAAGDQTRWNFTFPNH